MDIEALSHTRLIVLALLTAANLLFSWRALHNPSTHGFYRFFVFEGIILLLVISGSPGPTAAPLWLKSFSRWLYASSILSVVAGYYQLRRHGGHEERRHFPENRSFENTTFLVNRGIYRYIRHPMYSALLLLIWGSYLGYPTLVGLPVALLSTMGVYVAARVEERENIAYFGEQYRAYMKSTKRFIPYLG